MGILTRLLYNMPARLRVPAGVGLAMGFSVVLSMGVLTTGGWPVAFAVVACARHCPAWRCPVRWVTRARRPRAAPGSLTQTDKKYAAQQAAYVNNGGFNPISRMDAKR